MCILRIRTKNTVENFANNYNEILIGKVLLILSFIINISALHEKMVVTVTKYLKEYVITIFLVNIIDYLVIIIKN